jgi:uncharacterized protein YuzE
MRMHFDGKAGALYLRLDDSAIIESEEVQPGIILDFNSENQVVGIEVLDLAIKRTRECCGYYSGDEATVKRGLATYIAVLAAAVCVQYLVEVYLSAKLALETRAVVPWILSAVWYAALGAAAAIALRSWRIWSRVLLLALIAVLPHMVFEITHGSDPAYPYIGLFMIIPDLLWVAVGAVIATMLLHRQRVKDAAR